MKTTKTITAKFLTTAFVVAAFSTTSHAAPVLASGASYKTDGISNIALGTNTTITQTGKDAKINWNSFDTTAGESVTFIQPGKNSVVINKVVDGMPTSFLGTLNANGDVVIQNSAGITFGQGSHVNVNSLTATTANNMQANADGTYTANNMSDNAVNFNGSVNAADGGYVYAMARQINVGNTGTLTANKGNVDLQAGQQSYVVDLKGNNKILYSTDISNDFNDGKVVAVNMNGTITAHQGDVLIRTRANNMATGVINLTGVVDTTTLASQASGRAGDITLNSSGTLTNSGTLNAYSNGSNAGNITLNSQYGNVNQNGALNVGSISKNAGNINVSAGNSLNSNGANYAESFNGKAGSINMQAAGAFNDGASAYYDAHGYEGGGTVALEGSKTSNFGGYNTTTGKALVHNQIDTGSTYGAQGTQTIQEYNNATGNYKNL